MIIKLKNVIINKSFYGALFRRQEKSPKIDNQICVDTIAIQKTQYKRLDNQYAYFFGFTSNNSSLRVGHHLSGLLNVRKNFINLASCKCK